MQIYTQKKSGRHFLLIEARTGRKAIMVSPEGEVKTVELERLEHMLVLGLKKNIVVELLTENQLRIYHERVKV